MDQHWHEDTRELERQVRELMAHQVLPAEIVGYDVEFGTHWYGDPAVWLDLHVPATDVSDAGKARRLSDLRLALRRSLKDIAPHRLAIVQTRQPPAVAAP